ncbi:MAG: hypothetical protein MK312_00260 [Roseibacillus sp.]|nr:hypothetical protein [Roseibacillus sp.]
MTCEITNGTFCRMRLRRSISSGIVGFCLNSCGTFRPEYWPPNMDGPSSEQRREAINTETKGDFYIGRRYHVNRTWWGGYIRKPGEPWARAELVVFNQGLMRAPDNLPHDGPRDARHAYDHNYEYRIWGVYTGETVYEPNSNQFLPEFQLKNYELLSTDPGWLFDPRDHYDPHRLTLHP